MNYGVLGTALGMLPQALLSRGTGWLVRLKRPQTLARLSVRVFARAFGVNLQEAEVPAGGFSCIGDLFTRSLKPGARSFPSHPAVPVSPVDGVLRSARPVSEGLEQVKGVTYSLQDLLGGDALAPRFASGWAFNFYLSPPDYHHIHSPLEGTVVRSRYIPGRLWPVNDWALHHIPGLFCENERLVTFMETPAGLIAVVMVGAFNVGRMSVSYDSWLTNTGTCPPAFVREYQTGHQLARGDRLGTFHMGSSVVLLTERLALDAVGVPSGAKSRALGRLRLGDPLFV